MLNKNMEHRRKDICRSILFVMLLGLPAIDAAAQTYKVVTPLEVDDTATFSSDMTIDTTEGAPLNVATDRLVVSGGLTGLGTTPSGARLDVKYTGSGNKVQIWRNSGGTEVANMSDSGALSPAQQCNTAYPSNAVIFHNGACPSGWTELTNAQGRYLVGLPSGGTMGGTQGTILTNTESRPSGGHSHPISDPTHLHTGDQYDSNFAFGAMSSYFIAVHGGQVTDNNAANITVGANPVCASGTCTTNGTNAPYIQFRVCQKD